MDKWITNAGYGLDCPRIEDMPFTTAHPRSFAACEHVSGGDSSFGQNWDGSGCQSQQDAAVVKANRMMSVSMVLLFVLPARGRRALARQDARVCDGANYARVCVGSP